MFQLYLYVYTHILRLVIISFLLWVILKRWKFISVRLSLLAPANLLKKKKKNRKYKIAPSHKNLGNFALNSYFSEITAA